MNRFTFSKLVLIVVMALLPLTFYGQNTEKDAPVKATRADFKNYLYATGDLGLGFLYGDNDTRNLRGNGHLGIGYQFDNILGIKGNIGYGVLNGELKDVYKIGLIDYLEANLNLTINLTDIILGYNPERKWNVVPHVGIGQIQFRSRLENWEGQTIAKMGYDDNDGINVKGGGIINREVVATIPMGLEVNYQLNDKWGVYIDYTANYVDSDLLDQINRGDHNDWFNSLSLGASYRFKNDIFVRDRKFCNYWFITMDGGGSFLYGDNDPKVRDMRGNFNLGVGYHFHNFYSVYGKIGYGILHGEKEKAFTVGYCDYIAANVNVSADLVNLIFGYKENRVVALSPHVGLGQIQYRSRVTMANGTMSQLGYDNDSKINTKGNGISGRRVVLTVPMGVEFTYNMKEHWDFFVDYTANYCNSDILDCVAWGEHSDWYNTANIGLRYKFNTSCKKDQMKEEEEKVTPQMANDQKDNQEEEKEETSAEPVTTDTVFIEKAVTYHQNYTDINFPIGKSEKLDSQSNRNALNRATSDINDGFKVQSVVVEGYASPEGSKETNDRLSKERAQVAADFVKDELSNKTDVSNVEFKIEAKGADWDGLIEAIDGSDIKDKDEIVKKLNNSSNREQELNNIIAKYPQVKQLFPQLRRAGVTIISVK